MIVSLPWHSCIWQLTDNYVYTHYYLQTNTLSQTVAIHSWPDFDDLPRGYEANLNENEASVARGQRRAEARYYEAEAEANKFGLEAVLSSRT